MPIDHHCKKYTNDWPDLHEFRGLTQKQAIEMFSRRQVAYGLFKHIDFDENVIVDQVLIKKRTDSNIDNTMESKKNFYYSRNITKMEIDPKPITLPTKDFIQISLGKCKRRRRRKKNNMNRIKKIIMDSIQCTEIRTCRTGMIDERTKVEMMNKSLYRFEDNGRSCGNIRPADVLSSVGHGGKLNVFLEFSSSEDRNNTIIQLPMARFCPTYRQSKMSFLEHVLYGWESVTNCLDFSDVIDYFLDGNWAKYLKRVRPKRILI